MYRCHSYHSSPLLSTHTNTHIQPENILLQTDEESSHLNIKVSDFGLVAFADNCQMIESTAGTPFYMGTLLLTWWGCWWWEGGGGAGIWMAVAWVAAAELNQLTASSHSTGSL